MHNIMCMVDKQTGIGGQLIKGLCLAKYIFTASACVRKVQFYGARMLDRQRLLPYISKVVRTEYLVIHRKVQNHIGPAVAFIASARVVNFH